MKKAFAQLPHPLQKQILIRAGLGALFLVVTIALVFMTWDVYVILPAAAMLVFCLAGAFLLFRRGATGDYIVVRGICMETGKTLLTRRIKTILIKTDEYTVQISPRHRPHRILPSACLELYIAPSTPVYEKDGVQMLPSYIAMEVKGGIGHGDKHL